jgi:hypothetical protein
MIAHERERQNMQHAELHEVKGSWIIVLMAVLCAACDSRPPRAQQSSQPAPPSEKAAPECATLEGKVGSSDEWGSGWMDLNQPIDFPTGSHLKITVGGSASRVLVRALREGQSHDKPGGVLGAFTVPASRVVEVAINAPKPGIGHISVHGSSKPFDWDLGSGNGPASLSTIEYCK